MGEPWVLLHKGRLKAQNPVQSAIFRASEHVFPLHLEGTSVFGQSKRIEPPDFLRKNVFTGQKIFFRAVSTAHDPRKYAAFCRFQQARMLKTGCTPAIPQNSRINGIFTIIVTVLLRFTDEKKQIIYS